MLGFILVITTHLTLRFVVDKSSGIEMLVNKTVYLMIVSELDFFNMASIIICCCYVKRTTQGTTSWRPLDIVRVDRPETFRGLR
jgi:hypothetical protein